ncbi:MAG: hypothetical protein ACRD4S_02840 [Candidatus Acidiferrales bacterium]
MLLAIAISLLFSPCGLSQTKAAARKKAAEDRLGLTCAQILRMTSTDWVARYVSVKNGASDANAANGKDRATLGAIDVYGKCYDERTNRLAASLRRSGKGPLMGARGNFQDFEQALKNFEAKALADSDPPADAVKSAYAALYEKQFRYGFYRSYAPVKANAPARAGAKPGEKPPAASIAKPGRSSNVPSAGPGTAGAASSAGSISRTPMASGARSKETQNANGSDDSSTGDVSEFTKVKNHFGELLAALPEDKSHEIHAAFGQILGENPVSEDTREAVYRYAIFLLEPPSGKPFSPPPF